MAGYQVKKALVEYKEHWLVLIGTVFKVHGGTKFVSIYIYVCV